MLDERMRALAQAPLLKGLTSATLLNIAHNSSSEFLVSGGTLSWPTARCASLFLIVSGCVRLSLLSTGGREFVVSVAGRGEILGELTAPGASEACQTPQTFVAVAQETTHLLRTSWHALSRMIENADLTRRCNEILAERIDRLLEVIEDLAVHPLDARLARLLSRLQTRSASSPFMRLHRFDQGTLALMANATRPKVNQHLQRLQRLGAIEIEGGAVRVLDRAMLAEIGQRE
jgi:CRP/FNR family transcriptional regulator, cyclic AMP receptor protein